MRIRSALILACACFAALPNFVRTEEGFWPFDMVPRDRIAKRFEFTVTDEWLNKVRRASLRVSTGGSGAFVSPHGLAMTNRHVVASTLQRLSVPGKTDLIQTGFLAKTQAEELRQDGFRADSLRLEQLIEIVNINEKMRAASARLGSADAALQALQREAQNAEGRGIRVQAVKFYHDGEYRLYKFKVYTDVRVVFAADVSSGYFGGDKDNFMYPRYDFDVAFVRAYENGKPAETPDYFQWSDKGAKTNELVFFAGNPAGTNRAITLARMEFERDCCLPVDIALFSRESAALRRFGELGAEQKQQTQARLHSCENALKRLRGQLDGLKDPQVFEQKKLGETAEARSIADPLHAKAYADAQAEMCRCCAGFSNNQVEFRLLSHPWGFNSAQLSAALLIAAMEESGRYNFSAAQGLESRLQAQYSYDPAHRAESERRFLEESFALLLSQLGAEHALARLMLEGKTPAQRAQEVLSASKMGSAEFYRTAERSFPGIDKSGDAMLILAKKLHKRRNDMRLWQAEFDASEKKCYATIATALTQRNGVRPSPDGNFTPRLSFGTVLGYEENGKRVAPFTCVHRMFELSDRAGNQEPYHLTQTWLDGRYKLDPCTPLNFVTDADGYGGNSGSPVFNRNSEVVGLLFDGNYPGLVGKYVFDERTKRSVCVDSRAIVEVMRRVYGAEALVKEFAR